MSYRDPDIFAELRHRSDWERKKGPRDPYKLDRMRLYAQRAGNPQDALRGVYHVAGSKGKGSTALFLAGLLETLGYKTGLYTSPHLSFWSERITRAGIFWDSRAYEQALGQALQYAVRDETVFEILTLAAWLLFLQQGCERTVIEVGLGGRLDATNLVSPFRCLITRLELEHTDVLGNTLTEIASEKAGIIKPGVAVWTYRQHPEAASVLAETAARQGSPLYVLEEEYEWKERAEEGGVSVEMQRAGSTYRWKQPNLSFAIARNAALALACVLEAEQTSEEGIDALLQNLPKVSLPARMEWIAGDPPVLLDGAHTPQSIEELVQVLRRLARPLVLVYGANADKDVGAMARRLDGLADRAVLTQSGHPRSLPPAELVPFFGRNAEVITDPQLAFVRACQMCPPGGLVVVTGSLYLAAAVRELVVPC